MKPIHPFPARMAPELVKEKFISMPEGSKVLDPMCGSGTSLKYAIDTGLKPVGWDIDPLAVKMARTWCRRFDTKRLRQLSEKLRLKLDQQRALPPCRFNNCKETQEFVDYWFAREQRDDLNRLSIAIEDMFPPGRTRDFFQIALSRIIITKFKGASLAWDISHSRPHKKKITNNYQTLPEFFRSFEKLVQLCEATPNKYDASIELRDCRMSVPHKEFDFVITSPPYLNAIDYMRGHKFSLIWMGYTIPQLKKIRSNSVGVERGIALLHKNEKYQKIIKDVCTGRKLNPRVRKYLLRYINDCEIIIKRMRSTLKPTGSLVMVIGNSSHYGTKISNDKIFVNIATNSGFKLIDKKKRSIARKSRYLPMLNGNQSISNRIKTESVIQFAIA